MAEPATASDPIAPDAEERALLAGEVQLDAGQGIPLADMVRWLESRRVAATAADVIFSAL